MSFHLGFGLQFELTVDETVVSAELHIGHHSHVKNVLKVPLAHKYIVKKMRIFGLSMRQSCFQAVPLLEDSIGNDKKILFQELEQEAPVVITVTYALPTNDSLPRH